MGQSLDEAIQKSLTYITTAQQPTGNWNSLSSRTTDPFVVEKTYETTFNTSLILHSLARTPYRQQIHNCLVRGTGYLLAQRSPGWSWNYWDRTSETYRSLPYPDDLDDTSLALSTIYLNQPDALDGDCLGKVTRLLIATEQTAGGPYRTWLAPKEADTTWQDIDLAVNANIGYFLRLQGIRLPQLTAYLEQAIENEDWHSRYYPNPYPVLYYLSRGYQGRQHKKLAHTLLEGQHEDGSWGTPLNTALAVLTLSELNAPIPHSSAALEYLLRSQVDNHWKAEAFCLDPAQGKQLYYAGSPVLTTAFCVEALASLKNNLRADVPQKGSRKILEKSAVIHVATTFEAQGPDIAAESQSILNRLLQGSTGHQILELPDLFRQSLKPKYQSKDPELIENLQRLSLYGWIAYTIYDDFFDNQGSPALLSVANISLRHLTDIFRTILPQSLGFNEYAEEVLNTMEQATTWEIRNCRFSYQSKLRLSQLPQPNFEDYQRLADRSAGHALNGLAQLFAAGIQPDSPSFKQMENFFRHFLIARQLCDDAHDWQTDLRKGQLNPVANILIASYPSRKRHTQLEKAWPNLEQLFWQETIETVCQEINRQCSLARKYLHQCKLIEKTDILENLIEEQELVVQTTLHRRQETLNFLRALAQR